MERNNKKDYSIEDIEQKIKELKGFEGHEYSKEEIIKILEQQKYIAEQEKEISELAREKDEHE